MSFSEDFGSAFDQVASPMSKLRQLDGLKRAITESGLTHYAIGKSAGVSPGIIDRFMRGERDLQLATASKFAIALGLQLTATSARSSSG